jgi:hypothetical protein
MPLNLEVQEHKESAEIRELKRTVRTAAQKMAKKHNMCGVVDQTLKEIGIDSTDTMTIEAQLIVPITVSVFIDPHSFAEMSHEEQIKTIQDGFKGTSMIMTLRNSAFQMGSYNSSAKDVQVLDLNQAIGADRTPAGYNRYYTSDEGRVVHFVSQYGSALCGVETWNHWTEHSPRGTGSICLKCSTNAERRGLL